MSKNSSAVRKPKSNVRVVTGAVIEGRGKPELDRDGQLRPWQADAYVALAGKRLALVNSGTGSGKSTCAEALAAYWVARGRRVLVAVPQDLVVESFCRPGRFALPDGGTLDWPALEKSKLTTAGLVEWANDATRMDTQVVSHALLVAAHRDGARFDNVVTIIDEVHRASAGTDGADNDNGAQGANRLGAVIGHFAATATPAVLMTATFWREDATTIVPDAHREQLAVYARPPEDALGAAGLTVRFSYLAGPTDECLAEACSRMSKQRPGIVWLSPAMSVTSVRLGGKASELDMVLAHAPKPALDLVTVEGRDERKAKLFRNLKAGKGPTSTVCLSLGFEGYDDARLCVGVLVGARGSIRATIQAMGRLWRAYPGKSHVEFIIVLPEFGDVTVEQLSQHLNEVLAALVIKWYLLPPGSMGAAKALRDPTRNAKTLDELMRAAVTEGAAGVQAVLNEEFREDASEVGEYIARSLPRARGGLLREVLKDAPTLDFTAEAIASGLVAYASTITAGRLVELRAHYEARAALSATQRAGIIQRHLSGASLNENARAGGCGVTTVTRVLDEAGIRKREKRGGAGDLAAGVESLRSGAGLIKAAKLHRVGPQRLSRAARAAGVAVPAALREGAAERMSLAVESVRGGMGLQRAAKSHRVDQARLGAACAEANVAIAASPHEGAAERMDAAVSAVRSGVGLVKAASLHNVSNTGLSEACKACGVVLADPHAGGDLESAVLAVAAGGAVSPAARLHRVSARRLSIVLKARGFTVAGIGCVARWVPPAGSEKDGC